MDGQTYIHMHVRNAVALVWGSFRFAPITSNLASINIAEIQFLPLDKVASLPQGVLFVVLNHLRSV